VCDSAEDGNFWVKTESGGLFETWVWWTVDRNVVWGTLFEGEDKEVQGDREWIRLTSGDALHLALASSFF
jgi:hypothetical protein